MSTKFRLTTMEEDFTSIGLIRESRQETTEVPGEDPADVVEDDDEDDDEDGDGIAEGAVMKRVKRGQSAILRKVMRRKNKQYYKKNKGSIKKRNKQNARSAGGKRKSAIRADFWKKHVNLKGKKGFRLSTTKTPTGGNAKQMSGLDRVANMVEEVAGIIGTIGERSNREFVKGFANIALISDTMARGFTAMGTDIEEPDLVSLGEAFAEMAENAATVAEGVDAGQIEADEELEELFKAEMEDMLAGLETYADLTEDEDEDEEPVEEEEDEDDEDVAPEDDDEEGKD